MCHGWCSFTVTLSFIFASILLLLLPNRYFIILLLVFFLDGHLLLILLVNGLPGLELLCRALLASCSRHEIKITHGGKHVLILWLIRLLLRLFSFFHQGGGSFGALFEFFFRRFLIVHFSCYWFRLTISTEACRLIRNQVHVG